MWGEINVKVYEKPEVSVDAGMAEGVYAASGATDQGGFSVSFLSKNVYYQESGALTYRATWNSGNIKSITLVFNQNIDSASANTNVSISGRTVTLSYSGWAPISPLDITVVVSTGLSSLNLESYSCEMD